MSKKRLALVTGGTRGIGRAISMALLKEGYHVVANYHSDRVSAQAFEAETTIPTMSWDVSDYEACQASVKQIHDVFGPIEILVNNAGITRDRMCHKMSFGQWSEVITTNLTSCFTMTQPVLQTMRDNNFGRIINISSINGKRGQVGQTNYSAAKAGVIGFTKALALENASKGITVNAVLPGYIDTQMSREIPSDALVTTCTRIPLQRFGFPEDVARAVVFLASEQASYITGSSLEISGGI